MKPEDRKTQLLRKADYEAMDPASDEFRERYPQVVTYGIIAEGLLVFPNGAVFRGLTKKEGKELVRLINDELAAEARRH